MKPPSLESIAEVMTTIKSCCDVAHRGIRHQSVSYFISVSWSFHRSPSGLEGGVSIAAGSLKTTLHSGTRQET